MQTPGHEAVLQGVPDVLVNAVADAIEFGHVWRHSRMPAHLHMEALLQDVMCSLPIPASALLKSRRALERDCLRMHHTRMATEGLSSKIPH